MKAVAVCQMQQPSTAVLRKKKKGFIILYYLSMGAVSERLL